MTARGPRTAGPTRLTEATIQLLLPFVDEQSLRVARPRVSAPWSWLPRLLRVSAVTLGRDICFRPRAFRESDVGGLALIAHECTHVRQYRELGAARFLLRYLLGAFRVRFVHDLHPLEREPEAVQARARSGLRL